MDLKVEEKRLKQVPRQSVIAAYADASNPPRDPLTDDQIIDRIVEDFARATQPQQQAPERPVVADQQGAGAFTLAEGSLESAFYWFNSETIANAGNALYGRFVYRQLLLLLSPAKQHEPEMWLALFDGDCMAYAENLRWRFRAADSAVLDEAERLGESLCFVVAIAASHATTLEMIDGELWKTTALGYMGVTRPESSTVDAFLALQSAMALVVAARIDGGTFKRISYGFHSDADLFELGFTAVTHEPQ